MTRTIDDYLDVARRGIREMSSDRRISKALNVTPATVNAWRSKRQWPTDEAMIALADLIEVPRAQALLDLSRWRSKSANATETWDDIANELPERFFVPLEPGEDEVSRDGLVYSKGFLEKYGKPVIALLIPTLSVAAAVEQAANKVTEFVAFCILWKKRTIPAHAR